MPTATGDRNQHGVDLYDLHTPYKATDSAKYSRKGIKSLWILKKIMRMSQKVKLFKDLQPYLWLLWFENTVK